MDSDDLNALCRGAPAEEVDQLHRLLHQWTVGPENSYPVQLALLTRAQWRAAASIPRALDDSRKQLELQLVEYRKQATSLIGNLERIGREQAGVLREIIDAHRSVIAKTEYQEAQRDVALEAVADRLTTSLECAEASWIRAKTAFESEQRQLAKAREDLETRQNWRDWLVFAGLVSTVLLLGVVVGVLLSK